MSTQFVIPFVNATFKEKLIYLYVDGVMWIFPGSPWLSILEATTAVSPRTIYLGIFVPNTPPTTEPVCTPILIWKHISISNYANLQASIWLGKLFFLWNVVSNLLKQDCFLFRSTCVFIGLILFICILGIFFTFSIQIYINKIDTSDIDEMLQVRTVNWTSKQAIYDWPERQ